MHAKHVLYVRALLRALQTGIEKTNPLITNQSSLLRKKLGSLCGLLLFQLLSNLERNFVFIGNDLMVCSDIFFMLFVLYQNS